MPSSLATVATRQAIRLEEMKRGRRWKYAMCCGFGSAKIYAHARHRVSLTPATPRLHYFVHSLRPEGRCAFEPCFFGVFGVFAHIAKTGKLA